MNNISIKDDKGNSINVKGEDKSNISIKDDKGNSINVSGKNENKYELTDDEIDQIVETLKENQSENTKKLREIINDDSKYPYNALRRDLKSGYAKVKIDQESGVKHIVGPTELEKDMLGLDDIDTEEKLIDISNEEIIKNSKQQFEGLNINEEDANKLITILTRVNSGEEFNILSELPSSIKKMIYSMSDDFKPATLNANAKLFVNMFLNELKTDKELVNFQNALKKELNIPEIPDLFEKFQKDLMEKDIIKKADELEAKGFKDKADKLRGISKSYISSYKYDKFFTALDNKCQCCKRLDKEIKKYKRYCNNFNYKYENNAFSINDVDLVTKTLSRHLENISEDSIKKFVVMFCRICMNLNPNNMDEHAYMYYTIKNILSLDFLDHENKFYKELINSVTEVINKIEEYNKIELKEKDSNGRRK